MDPNTNSQPPINQQPAQTPTAQPPQQIPTLDKDSVSTFSIATVAMTVIFPFVGMIMSIIGLQKAKKTGSQINKVFALVCLGLSIFTQLIMIGAVILAFNSPSYKQRKADQAATKQAADNLYDEVSTRQDVNLVKYDKIQNGMSLTEVKIELDSNYAFCDGESSPVDSGTVTCAWGPGLALDKYIKITFTDGLVVSKTKSGF